MIHMRQCAVTREGRDVRTRRSVSETEATHGQMEDVATVEVDGVSCFGSLTWNATRERSPHRTLARRASVETLVHVLCYPRPRCEVREGREPDSPLKTAVVSGSVLALVRRALQSTDVLGNVLGQSEPWTSFAYNWVPLYLRPLGSQDLLCKLENFGWSISRPTETLASRCPPLPLLPPSRQKKEKKGGNQGKKKRKK